MSPDMVTSCGPRAPAVMEAAVPGNAAVEDRGCSLPGNTMSSLSAVIKGYFG